jgi:prepilin-type N-terminal cleavage/methylation domain-containing protein
MNMNSRKHVKGFTLVEIMTTVAIIGILASMAIPAFTKYVRRARTSEAVMNLRKLFDGSVEYFARDYVSRSGAIPQRRFPQQARLTPGTRFCRDVGGTTKWVPKADYWTLATWQALNFGISDPHYYSYAYDSAGQDKSAAFTARAVGDLNCNQTFSTFERVGTVDVNMNVVGGGGIYTIDELE